MSTVVDQARNQTPLTLKDELPAMFLGDGEDPCIVTLPGGTNIGLGLFEVTATGIAKPSGPGMVTLTLYGRATLSGASQNPTHGYPSPQPRQSRLEARPTSRKPCL